MLHTAQMAFTFSEWANHYFILSMHIGAAGKAQEERAKKPQNTSLSGGGGENSEDVEEEKPQHMQPCLSLAKKEK